MTTRRTAPMRTLLALGRVVRGIAGNERAEGADFLAAGGVGGPVKGDLPGRAGLPDDAQEWSRAARLRQAEELRLPGGGQRELEFTQPGEAEIAAGAHHPHRAERLVFFSPDGNEDPDDIVRLDDLLLGGAGLGGVGGLGRG